MEGESYVQCHRSSFGARFSDFKDKDLSSPSQMLQEKDIILHSFKKFTEHRPGSRQSFIGTEIYL